MIRKVAAPTPGYVRVLFELPSCLWADRIFLVGDFNQWNDTATPMHQGRDGVWRATVDLPHGSSYEFRYLIDGKWTSDSHADGFAQNSFGVSNSIVHALLPISALLGTERQVREVAPWGSLQAASHVAHQSHPAHQSSYDLGEIQRATVAAPTRIAA